MQEKLGGNSLHNGYAIFGAGNLGKEAVEELEKENILY